MSDNVRAGPRPATDTGCCGRQGREAVCCTSVLDVHRRRTQIAALDDEGHELFRRNVPNDPEKLGDMLVGFEPGTPVVFEATYASTPLAGCARGRG